MRNKLFSCVTKIAVLGMLIMAFPVATFADEIVETDAIFEETALEDSMDESDETNEAIVYGNEDFVLDGDWIVKYVGSPVVDLVIPSEINGVTITGIKREAFRNASIGTETALGSVTIPASIRHIGAYAFDNCPYLKTVVFEDDNSAMPGTVVFYGNLGGKYAAGSSTFQNCKRLEKIVLSNQIKIIPCHFAQDCGALTEVEFSKSVEEIWSSAFANCGSLNKIDLSKTGVKIIGSSAFSNTPSVTEIKFPETLEEIGEQAFTQCGNGSDKGLGTLTLPASIKKIGAWAFSANKYLGKVVFTDVADKDKLVDGLVFVGNMGGNGSYSGVFEGCEKLESIVLSNNIKSIGNGFAKNDYALKEVKWNCELENIGAAAFWDCSALEKIDISNTKVKIANSEAFFNTTSAKQILLPKTLEEIGEQAFAQCGNGNEKALGTLILPASVKKIGAWAFKSNKYLGTVIFTDVEENDKLIEGIIFVGNMGGNGTYSGVFEECENLKGIRLSNNVKTVGKGFAKGCPKLKNIIFPSDFKGIGYEAFHTDKVDDKLVSTSVTSGIFAVTNYDWKNDNRTISGKEPVVEVIQGGDEDKAPSAEKIGVSVNEGENLIPKQRVDLTSYFADVHKKGVKYEVLPKGIGTYSKGKFTAKKVYDGEISIVAYTKKGSKKTILKTVVLKEKIVQPVKLFKSTTLIKTGSTISENQIFAEGAPKVTGWKSSKTSVATVDEKTGTVTAEGKSGKATISMYFGNVKYTFTLVVKLPKLSCKPVKVGDTKTISVTMTELVPTSFRSLDEAICKVNSSGVVTGVSQGVTTVYVTIDGAEYPCKITIK